MPTTQSLGALASVFIAILCVGVQAQSIPQPRVGESPIAYVNRQAVLSRTGNQPATVELVHQLYKTVGVPEELGDTLGFTNRITQAEVDYRHRAHQAVHESDVVNAVNNLGTTLGAPQWAHTNLTEVRKLRMHMVAIYPQLIAGHEPPDSKGHYKAVSDSMGPMEASYLATTLVYQKAHNSDYQFTDAEKAQNAGLDAATVKTKHLERKQAIQNLFSGQNQSIGVLSAFTAVDHFYSDLGVPSLTNNNASVTSNGGNATEGGR